MNSTGTALDSSSLKRELRSAIASGMGLDDLIRKMRGMGCNKIASIKLLREFKGMSLGEAKAAVHFSPAWAGTLDSDNALHEAAFAAAEETGFTEQEGRDRLAG
jgi:hypothetical protein